ncbi:Dabb family protein [Parabacteroides sp. PF5-9]|uniref:Dabb family protein n=1 Tax=Parabacteroides sp. PF5-9 TaxID=1742404 RepID=UPI0024761703|nr:Dabb family protein [Parabacteroides sp. PF5-9]MDH6357856.1 hypothetical protein [Parabacteroides sp. PF5-9]
MKRRQFIVGSGVVVAGSSLTTLLSSCGGTTALQPGEVLHTVTFSLKHPLASAEANLFIADAKRILTAVPGVEDFQAYRQCSPKSDMQYGFLMRFRDQSAMDAYTAHPDHMAFVTARWDTEVTQFQESDFISL